jgi:hypothetical protein
MAAGILLTLTTSATFAADAGILPISSRPYGKSYGQWAVSWWQWAFSIPEAYNPVTDTTGAFASVGQSGPVWFLAGTFGGSEERTFTVPAGKGLFLPVYQWIFGASVFDCEPSNPGVPCDVPTLRDLAAAATTSVKSLAVTIDGTAVPDVTKYRAISPDAFPITFPNDAVFGFPAGTFYPQVADGYWLMFSPLQSGSHEIRVHVEPDPAYGSTFDVILHITVAAQPKNHSVASE